MNPTRISRLVQLLGLLQAGGGLGPNVLAQRCGVSVRTVYRDLDILRDAGVPVLYDDDLLQYRIPGSYFLPPTNFTAEEALSVLMLCYELGGTGRLPFCGAAHSAALKLESSLPGPIREHVRQISPVVGIKLDPKAPMDGQRPVYDTLLQCIRRRRAVRIQYDGPSDQSEISTKLCPYRLLFSRRSWYVFGRSAKHRDVRTFNVGRIRKLEVLADTFEAPRGFSVERFLRNAWHLIAEDGPDEEVHVRFKKLVARNVAEVVWHKTQRANFRDDGDLDFYVTVSGLNEMSWWILGYGDQAEVIRPQRLREIVAERAKRAAEVYNGRLEKASPATR